MVEGKEKQQYKIWTEGTNLWLELINADGSRLMKKYKKWSNEHAKPGYSWTTHLAENGYELFCEGTREVTFTTVTKKVYKD